MERGPAGGFTAGRSSGGAALRETSKPLLVVLRPDGALTSRVSHITSNTSNTSASCKESICQPGSEELRSARRRWRSRMCVRDSLSDGVFTFDPDFMGCLYLFLLSRLYTHQR
ncbi:hypothetical protein EYF80_059021 [Liparis tanakae]|uniref:Uncharacterized protein n=1 Tax=Liparis tanakae TaxID=230148 RepID=A0A4Z2EPJ6_9TELE|nr:hypothetical protein EYF80_059021 [Liparis tanakae]